MPPADIYAVLEATWPPAARQSLGPWCIRDGQGGGKRVSAATAEGDWTAQDIPAAETAMQALGQPALFLIRDGDAALDAELASRGYRIVDPVVAYAAPCDTIAPPDLMTAFPHWPPLGIARDLWEAEGIGPERLAVMDRAAGPKTVILGRAGDRAAGVAFVAIHGPSAMLHALEVAPDRRRLGVASNILRASAHWAQDNGAGTLSLVVTTANAGARALYASLGLQAMGQYHYRQK
ncbi:GNAT family N-acetyltransferase [Rhodobacter ferrooxidans]|uniref:GNAT family N-acetyltransferase n=1 Tax=Rhodobacter ferrooxidans TaxID=371731 RepID=UPI000594E455|nr:GNAT family N-acetyltransferase [Rhodobacter sp. SW2]